MTTQTFHTKPFIACFAVLMLATVTPLAFAQSTTLPSTQPSDAVANKVKNWLSNYKNDIAELAKEEWAYDPLDKEQSRRVKEAIILGFEDAIRRKDADSFAKNEVFVAGDTLKFLKRTFGTKPTAGWPLFISLHGGGSAPAFVNDQQWQNQIKLYEFENALFIAPRAPGNTWDLWHESRIDPLLDRLISDAIVLGDVDPNRIYLMGYSAGGDGVYQLAPRMADRFAAASMMAGHPNSAQPDGLRNLPFAIHVGAMDDGYGRNRAAADWKIKLDALQNADPNGYIHQVQLHPGRAHWMYGEDSVAVPWMASFTRERFPHRVVWEQGELMHDRFYWLSEPKIMVRKDQLLIANLSGQRITVERDDAVDSVTILLNDQMMDLDQPVTVLYGTKLLFHGIIRRTIAAIAQTLIDRGDPSDLFDAMVTVKVLPNVPIGPDNRRVELDHCVKYLLDNMPTHDRSAIDEAFVKADAIDSLLARDRSPWAKQVPDELFLEYILPYCVADETRDNWRADLRPVAEQIVAGISSPGDAACKLNAELFQELHVKYDATRRPFPNESPSQSIACGYASCTGLSILLIDACRAVNIPARLVGIVSWIAPTGPTYKGGGNHSWVEIWDGRQWRFLGAGEPSELDHTWFTESAARSVYDLPTHAIFASGFTLSPDHFVLAWAPQDTSVPATNVTRFYTARTKMHLDSPALGRLEIWDQGRIVGAGPAGDFMLAKGELYTVQIFDAQGNKIAERRTDLESKGS